MVCQALYSVNDIWQSVNFDSSKIVGNSIQLNGNTIAFAPGTYYIKGFMKSAFLVPDSIELYLNLRFRNVQSNSTAFVGQGHIFYGGNTPGGFEQFATQEIEGILDVTSSNAFQPYSLQLYFKKIDQGTASPPFDPYSCRIGSDAENEVYKNLFIQKLR